MRGESAVHFTEELCVILKYRRVRRLKTPIKRRLSIKILKHIRNRTQVTLVFSVVIFARVEIDLVHTEFLSINDPRLRAKYPVAPTRRAVHLVYKTCFPRFIPVLFLSSC